VRDGRAVNRLSYILHLSISRARSMICSGSKPNFRCNSLSGAEAPKVFIPTILPAGPT